MSGARGFRLRLLAFCACLLLGACQTAQSGGAPSLDSAARAYSFGNYDSAYKSFTALAAQGEEEAYIYLAILYRNGWGTQSDQAEARRWSEKAALAGDPWGNVLLGDQFLTGKGGEQDVAEGLRHLQAAADQDLGYAQFLLGSFYYSGDYVEEDRLRGLAYWREAAEQGEAEAQYSLARALLREGPRGSASHDEALYWFHRADHRARQDARQGFLTEQDDDNWRLAASARAELAHQAYLLGRDRRDGVGGPEDRLAALMWFIIAASKGSHLAADALTEEPMGLTEQQVAEIREVRIEDLPLKRGLGARAAQRDLERAKEQALRCEQSLYRFCG